MSLEPEPYILKNVITENNVGVAAKWNPLSIGTILTDDVDVKILPIFRNTNSDKDCSLSDNADAPYLTIKNELCNNCKINLKKLSDWYNGRNTCDQLKKFSPKYYSSYAGYKHLDSNVKCNVSGKPIKEYADFKVLIGQLKSHDTIRANPPTLWVSYGPSMNDSHQCYKYITHTGKGEIIHRCCTPLHYDTYGCNVVAQIYGRKKWTLYAPSDTPYLYPSRLPYEESSVVSAVDPRRPDLTRFPLYAKASPYTVILEAGDMLFVPKHWWHFVECLSSETISLNCWIDTGLDDEERLKEILVSYLLHDEMGSKLQEWMVDSEEGLMDKQQHLYIMNVLHQKYMKSRDSSGGSGGSTGSNKRGATPKHNTYVDDSKIYKSSRQTSSLNGTSTPKHDEAVMDVGLAKSSDSYECGGSSSKGIIDDITSRNSSSDDITSRISIIDEITSSNSMVDNIISSNSIIENIISSNSSSGSDNSSSSSDDDSDEDSGPSRGELVLVRDRRHLITRSSQIRPIYDSTGKAAVRLTLAHFHRPSPPALYAGGGGGRDKDVTSSNESPVHRVSSVITQSDILRAMTEPNVIQLIVDNLNKAKK